MEKMRIGFNVRPLQTGHKFRGIGTYTYYLLKYLSNIDKGNNYLLFLDGEGETPDFNFLDKDFKKEVIKFPPWKHNSRIHRVWNQHVLLPRKISRAKIDVFHFTELNASLFHPFKNIITIYDLIPLKFPQFYGRNIFNEYRMRKWTARSADCIIAISENSKKDIMELMGIPEEKIRVIYLAADEIFRPLDRNQALSNIKANYGLENKFLLYVGGLEPRKNIEELLEVFKKVLIGLDEEYKLVITGVKDNHYPHVVKVTQDLKIEDKVILTGYISPQELANFYNAASCYVSASLYEGFGLPLLEAMACGTPVVTFDNSSIPEVVGDGALLVESGSTDKLAEGTLRILTDEALRRGLIEKGLKRAKRFSWEKTAKKTLGVYREIERGHFSPKQ